MTAENDLRKDLAERIEAIESGYEFLLAYAAQGRSSDKGAGAGRDVRGFLGGMAEALDGLGAAVTACYEARDAETARIAGPFLEAVGNDARVAGSAVRLVLAQADISSQLIDNLNASIHLRAVLTDLFIVDESLKAPPAA